ncbi:MAG: hypothetical protein QME77_12920 [bacterium]|nr:hypothetical protein [bacterium]
MFHSAFLLERLATQKIQEALREAESHRMASSALREARSLKKTQEVLLEADARGIPGKARRLIGQIGALMVAAGGRLERFGSSAGRAQKRRECSV